MRFLTGVLFAAAASLPLPAIAQQPPAAVDFSAFAPYGFSVVVRDAEQAGNAWADVLGLPAPMLFEPQHPVWPPNHGGDRAGVGPTIALLPMMNMSVTLHQPPPGNNYWRALLDAEGEVLYRMGFVVDGLPAVTDYFVRKGGKLVLGDPDRSSYVNIDLRPSHGFALEINERKPNPAQLANATSMRTIRTAPAASGARGSAFASNPVTTIAFVVPDLERAIQDYADVLGIPAASAVLVNRPAEIPLKTAQLRLPNGVRLELNEPGPDPSPWRAHLERHGRSMFSVGFRVKSVREQVAYLEGKGGALVLGGNDQRYAYVDFRSRLGLVIELRE